MLKKIISYNFVATWNIENSVMQNNKIFNIMFNINSDVLSISKNYMTDKDCMNDAIVHAESVLELLQELDNKSEYSLIKMANPNLYDTDNLGNYDQDYLDAWNDSVLLKFIIQDTKDIENFICEIEMKVYYNEESESCFVLNDPEIFNKMKQSGIHFSNQIH